MKFTIVPRWGIPFQPLPKIRECDYFLAVFSWISKADVNSFRGHSTYPLGKFLDNSGFLVSESILHQLFLLDKPRKRAVRVNDILHLGERNLKSRKSILLPNRTLNLP